uniref:Uncharacterized protein n=1 Tax=Anguilla anguilla TaxID=7936 RepID=A0A0E9WD12_ANGAN
MNLNSILRGIRIIQTAMNISEKKHLHKNEKMRKYYVQKMLCLVERPNTMFFLLTQFYLIVHTPIMTQGKEHSLRAT